MTIFFAVLAVIALGFAVYVLLKNKTIEGELVRLQNEAQASVAEARKSAEEQIAAMQQHSQATVAEAQKLIDHQMATMQQETERVRQHYECESRKVQEAANALAAKTVADLEPLRKYEKLRDAETEVQQSRPGLEHEAKKARQGLKKTSMTGRRREVRCRKTSTTLKTPSKT